MLNDITVGGRDILGAMDFLATGILIPLGGFLAIVLVGWRWGMSSALEALQEGTTGLNRWLKIYIRVCFRYVAPALIVFVFLNAVGLFG